MSSSSQEWKNSVNQSTQSEKINNINNYITKAGTIQESSIDEFYKTTQDMLKVAKPDFLKNHPSMGSLIFAGLISTTENYFRDLFAQIIKICPLSKKHSSSQSISFGSVVWHGGINVERGAFENISFASSDNLKNTTRKYIKYDIKGKKDLETILLEYDKVCELRHGIVHSNSVLAGKNAVKLGINSSKEIVKIKINYDELQECAAICTTLVVRFNVALFEEISKRWAIDWPQINTYSIEDWNQEYKKIHEIFFSNIDKKNGNIDNPISWVKSRNRVKKDLNI